MDGATANERSTIASLERLMELLSDARCCEVSVVSSLLGDGDDVMGCADYA